MTIRLGSMASSKGEESTRVGRVLTVVYFVEVGFVLIVAPWTTYWDRNYFVEAVLSFRRS